MVAEDHVVVADDYLMEGDVPFALGYFAGVAAGTIDIVQNARAGPRESRFRFLRRCCKLDIPAVMRN